MRARAKFVHLFCTKFLTKTKCQVSLVVQYIYRPKNKFYYFFRLREKWTRQEKREKERRGEKKRRREEK